VEIREGSVVESKNGLKIDPDERLLSLQTNDMLHVQSQAGR